MRQVVLAQRRILVDGRPELILAGEVHYFRLRPDEWPDRLDRLRDCGCDTVATYVPWLWHELPDRSVDLNGRTHPQRDLAAFLDLAHERGLRAIVRPGPFVMAELKNEGIPYRLYEDTPHLLPVTWDGAPVPSRTLDYLAPAFLDAVDGWYAAVMPLVAARLAPRGGPVVAVQLDNEIGMLSWVTNSPDLTDTVCADLWRWAVDRYGPDAAAARHGGDPATTATTLRHPPEERSLAVHDDLGRYMRDRYRRYVAFLRERAERYGVSGVPFLVNLHGTDRGRGRTFPIGISQLAAAYRGQPQLTSGSDHYLGDLTVANAGDLYVGNAFMAAVHDADQPLTSLEFEAGNGDYGSDGAVCHPPEAVELKTRLCLAQGNRLLNLYLFAGGHNPPLARPVGDGNDRIAFTGEWHGFAAPIGPAGDARPGYHAIRRVLGAVRAVGDVLADSDEEHDGLVLGFVPDHYLTEYRHPASTSRAAQVADLERFRGMGAGDVLARALLFAGFSFPAVDLQSDALTTDPPPVLALASATTLGRAVQERLARYVHGGGRLLLHGPLPARDHDGAPCTVLADALGIRAVGTLASSVHHFPSVTAHGWADGRVEVRVSTAQLLESTGGTAVPPGRGGSATLALPRPVLTVVASGLPCGLDVAAGAGRAIVVAADYPRDLDFWRRAVGQLGVVPRLGRDRDPPGLVTTSTVDRTGQRLLHLVNVAPVPARVALTGAPGLVGRPLWIAARGGLMLPMGLRVGPATLVATTCEVVARTGARIALRPTQPDGDVAVFDTDRSLSVSRGEVSVDGTRVSVTTSGPEPFSVTVD
jgi:beta-galactosidase